MRCRDVALGSDPGVTGVRSGATDDEQDDVKYMLLIYDNADTREGSEQRYLEARAARLA